MRIMIIVIITILALAFFRFYITLKKKYEVSETANEKNSNEKKKTEVVETPSLGKEDIAVIESEKILFRPLDIKDTKPLSVLMSNPMAVTPVGLPTIKKVSQLTPLMKEFCDTIGTYAIILKSSERLIGLLEIDPLDENVVGLKFFLGKQFWRHGFGKAVLELAESYLRKEGYKEIRAQIKISPENKAFLEQEGFTLEHDFYILKLK